MTLAKSGIACLIVINGLCAGAQTPSYDLAITHASIFNSNTGGVTINNTILIGAGIIKEITGNQTRFVASKTIDAKGRLVTAGFMDIHSHLTNVLGDYDKAPLDIKQDSIAVYRTRNALTYLPFGITTIRIVGEPEQWIPMTLQWQKQPLATEPDIYTCGAALVSEEPNRKTYISHVVVHDPADAEKKVQQYYDMGIRDIKLYWRLRYPELTAAFHKATELHMNVCAHIDRKVASRDSVVILGIKDLEHLHPYGIDLLSNEALQEVQDSVRKYYPSPKGGFLGWEMEVWKKLGLNNPKMLNSITLLKKHQVSLTPTIHIFGQALGLSYIKAPVTIENDGLNTTDFTPLQMKRCLEGYRVMMSYLRKMVDEGVQLNIGTDCPDAGRAALSEMLLIHETGVPMAAVLQMATRNNARAIGRSALYGSIEKGKRADLVMFDTNPLENAGGLTGKKTIIKDGIEYKAIVK